MDCFENAGRLAAADYRRATLYSTLSPCDMCSGTALLYGVPRVVIGENHAFQGPEDYLRSRGVEIEIVATGLNFRDVMWAQGLLPEEALEDGFAGPTIGMECSGVVTRTGAACTRFQPGDRVIAFAPSCFATHVTVHENAVAPLPEGVDLTAAATIPTTFLTAWYGLVELAHLSEGETILIHGGAGGVGLAALQIAAAVLNFLRKSR
jgi:NADPH:quinone reductase-like Zn-dependent oxidoreductase